jgi:hypothetical protein
MTQEDLQSALEALGKSGITVNGDLVLEKKVDYEVANVENGGIGIQITHGVQEKNAESTDKEQQNDSDNENEKEGQRDEELFHFVHPELNEAEEWRIHDAVKRIVKLQGVQMICQYLVQLKDEKKVLLPPNPSAAYTELVRMGMPDGEGFNETTFRKYYNKPIAPNAK